MGGGTVAVPLACHRAAEALLAVPTGGAIPPPHPSRPRTHTYTFIHGIPIRPRLSFQLTRAFRNPCPHSTGGIMSSTCSEPEPSTSREVGALHCCPGLSHAPMCGLMKSWWCRRRWTVVGAGRRLPGTRRRWTRSRGRAGRPSSPRPSTSSKYPSTSSGSSLGRRFPRPPARAPAHATWVAGRGDQGPDGQVGDMDPDSGSQLEGQLQDLHHRGDAGADQLLPPHDPPPIPPLPLPRPQPQPPPPATHRLSQQWHVGPDGPAHPA